MIKKKSIWVIGISSLLISFVLILTIIAFFFQLEMRSKAGESEYEKIYGRLQARLYQSYLFVINPTVKIETSGTLRDKVIVEGNIKNIGSENISDMLLKIRLQDESGAVIYEAIFDPLEPTFGTNTLIAAKIPYLHIAKETQLPKYAIQQFKHIVTQCPEEIYNVLKKEGSAGKDPRWPWPIAYEVVSVHFSTE